MYGADSKAWPHLYVILEHRKLRKIYRVVRLSLIYLVKYTGCKALTYTTYRTAANLLKCAGL